MPALPIEITDYVVARMLIDKPVFLTIKNFSLVSHQYRLIAFRQFFKVLICTTKSQWVNSCRIPGVMSWVRTLECTTNSLYIQTDNLSNFSSLRSVIIDFDSEGLGTHHDSAKLILSSLPPQISQLELLHVPSITTYLLSLVATHCRHLKTLVIHCSDRLLPDCCWNCYDEAGSCTVHSPIPDHYCDIESLTSAYGDSLKPLRKLVNLHLGIFLSDSDIFYDHLDHAGDFRFPPTRDTVKPYPPDQCGLCEGFAERARKMELMAAAAIASHLPSLESVTWSTWFARKEPGDDIENQTTTIWTAQDEDGIAARRTPW